MQIDQRNIFTIANFITLIRFFLALYSFYLVLYFEKSELVLILFIVFSVLDGIDGMVARLMNQRTMFGVYFDALVDSMFVVVVYLIFLIKGLISFPILFLIILPRLSTTLIYGVLRLKKFGPSIYRKISAFFLYITIPFVYFQFYQDYFIFTSIIIGILMIICEHLLSKIYEKRKN